MKNLEIIWAVVDDVPEPVTDSDGRVVSFNDESLGWIEIMIDQWFADINYFVAGIEPSTN